MNTLGKLMVLLIFIMSIVFLTFSFMVFMSQASWMAKEKAAQQQLQSSRTAKNAADNQVKQLKLDLSAANAARTNAISVLEGSLAQAQRKLGNVEDQYRVLQAEQQLQNKQVAGSVASLAAVNTKVDTLQSALSTTQGDYDKVFSENIDLRDRVIELEAEVDRRDDREAGLLDRLAKAEAVLRANDLTENDNISGKAPPREGKVVQVGGSNSKLLVVNLGEDDGIDRGHVLYIHRGAKYLGKAKVTTSYPDKAIGRVMEGFLRAAISEGDDVRTR